MLSMPILIHLPGKANPLHGFTQTVSASGAMIILPEGLSQGTKLSIENPKTQKKVDRARGSPSADEPGRLADPGGVYGAFAAVLERLFPAQRGLSKVLPHTTADQS